MHMAQEQVGSNCFFKCAPYRPDHDWVNSLKFVAVANGTIVAATFACSILITSDSSPAIQEIHIPTKANDPEILKLFVDHTGSHIVVTLANGENWYHSATATQVPRRLTKWKGLVIKEIAFNPLGNPRSTNTILVGTVCGCIYEAQLDVDGLDLYFSLVFRLNSMTSISGLYFETIHQSPGHTRVTFAVLTTTQPQNRLYHFSGGSTIRSLFTQHQSLLMPSSFFEMPGYVQNAELQCSVMHQRGKVVWSLGVLSSSGIFEGKFELNLDASPLPPEPIVARARMWTYPRKQTPRSVSLLDAQYLLLYETLLLVACRQTGLILEEISLLPGSAYVASTGAFVQDCVEGTLWLNAGKLYSISTVISEPHARWSVYLQHAAVSGHEPSFDISHQYCHSVRQKSLSMFTRGSYFFDNLNFTVAARYFSIQNVASFEEVALSFIRTGKTDALAAFLAAGLDTLNSHHKTQVAIVGTWYVEILLCQMMASEDAQKHRAGPELEHVLNRHQTGLHGQLTCRLLASHSYDHETSYLTALSKAHDQVVDYFVCGNRWEDMLGVLDVIPIERAEITLYNTAFFLLEHGLLPSTTRWTSRSLNPSKLLPALIRHWHSNPEFAPRCCEYLLGCVEHSTSEAAVRKYLLDMQPNENSIIHICAISSELFYMQTTLRMCVNRRYLHSCVWIYANLSLYEEAIALALKFDVSLAKDYANLPDIDFAMKKRLWLMIAEHITNDRSQVAQ